VRAGLRAGSIQREVETVEKIESPGLSTGQLIEDYRAMIRADLGHLGRALANGDVTGAHQFVDAIIENGRLIEDTIVNG
jgi:hypothetical protein